MKTEIFCWCFVSSTRNEQNQHYINLADVECGISTALKRSNRIFGGRIATQAEFPWTVSLQNRDGSHFCGGLILNKFYLISAAHCFEQYIYGFMSSQDLKSLKVISGTTDISPNALKNVKQQYIESVHIHQNFSHFYPDFDNDIAVVKVSGEGFIWGDEVQPGCLSTQKFPSEVKGVVAGWGSVGEVTETEEQRSSRFLRKVMLPLWNNEKCRMTYATKGIVWNTKESHVCAGYEDGIGDSCHGDSGSALFLDNHVGNRMIAYGIVSGGEGCSVPNLPGIYTKIPYFLKWITELVNDKNRNSN